MSWNGREIKRIICSCGGKVGAVATTKQERRDWGCSNDSEDASCCVLALECPKCGRRFTIALEAPEVKYV